ncbi:hypothetical protein Trydic_g6281 [Trypoxylus dichotomus]
MAEPPHRIASALKPLLFLLKILGLSSLRFDSDYAVLEIKWNPKIFSTIYDTILLLLIIVYGGVSIVEVLDSTWLTLIHIGILSFKTVKFIAWNVRRWKYESLLVNIWRRLTVNEKPYFKYGVQFNVGYITFWCLTSVMVNSFFKSSYILILLSDSDGANQDCLKCTLIAVVAVAEFPVAVICAEYLSYCLVLREYFLKIETAFTRMITRMFIVQGKSDSEYVKMIKLGYFSICDVCNNITTVLRFSIGVAVLEDITFITVHGHNLISKTYAGKITEFWFFDYHYSILLIIQHIISLFVVIIPAHLLLASANKIKNVLRNLETTGKNSEYMKDIKLFSLQILHEDFKIAPAGLLTINLGLAYVANKIKNILRNLETTGRSSEYTKNIKLFSLQILHEDFKVAPAGLLTIDFGLAFTVNMCITVPVYECSY